MIADDATKVDLSSRNLRAVPKEIMALKMVQTLALGFNKIVQLDSDIQFLTTLTKLTLTGNALKSLPDEIGALVELREVSLCPAALAPPPAAAALAVCADFSLFGVRVCVVSHRRIERAVDGRSPRWRSARVCAHVSVVCRVWMCLTAINDNRAEPFDSRLTDVFQLSCVRV